MIVNLFENLKFKFKSTFTIDELNFEDATELILFRNATVDENSYICIEKINVPNNCSFRFFENAKIHPTSTIRIIDRFIRGDIETEKLHIYNIPANLPQSKLTVKDFVNGGKVESNTKFMVDHIVLY